MEFKIKKKGLEETSQNPMSKTEGAWEGNGRRQKKGNAPVKGGGKPRGGGKTGACQTKMENL